MDGVAALRVALISDAPMIALVPAARIIAGPLPLNTVLPAISLQSVSKVKRNVPSPGATRFVRERVQATVHARNYVEQKAVQRVISGAAADKLAVEVEGISGVTIHSDGDGPDFTDAPRSVWLGTNDFLVTYTETR